MAITMPQESLESRLLGEIDVIKPMKAAEACVAKSECVLLKNDFDCGLMVWCLEDVVLLHFFVIFLYAFSIRMDKISCTSITVRSLITH